MPEMPAPTIKTSTCSTVCSIHGPPRPLRARRVVVELHWPTWALALVLTIMGCSSSATRNSGQVFTAQSADQCVQRHGRGGGLRYPDGIDSATFRSECERVLDRARCDLRRFVSRAAAFCIARREVHEHPD